MSIGSTNAPGKLTAADVGARPSDWVPTPAQVGSPPNARKINGKPLSADVTLTAADVGALPCKFFLKITFGSEFAGKSYTVTGVGGESYSGTVPAGLTQIVQVEKANTAYTVKASDRNNEQHQIVITTGAKEGQYEGTMRSATIYGAAWDGTSTTKWARTDGAAMFPDPVPYVAGSTAYGSPFDGIQPWAGMVKSERTGGTMVAIPKFWYKLTQNGKGISVQIANKALDGFSVSPAHMDRGDGKGERDVVYIGRYHCADDYKSKTGVLPVASITRATARTGIHALGANIWQNDFAMRFTLWLLYIVEFADWDSQSCIGKGCGNGSSKQNMGYTDSMPYHTGTTQSSRDNYGLGTQYRNIEGLWDNVLDWCDGCYNNSSGLNIILNPANFSDTTGGTLAGKPCNDYPSEFTVSGNGGFDLFFGSKGGGTSTTASCDCWSFYGSSPCVYVGGHYGRYAGYGLFYVYCNTASSASGLIGSRLQELP